FKFCDPDAHYTLSLLDALPIFPERNFLLRRLTEIAQSVKPALLRAWLERHWRDVGALLPQRPLDGLLPVARVIFPEPEAFSAWTDRKSTRLNSSHRTRSYAGFR